MARLFSSVGMALLAVILVACSAPGNSPAASGGAQAGVVAPSAAPPAPDSLSVAEFCAPFAAMAGASCSARYSCGEPALAELSAAACGCRNQSAPPAAERQRLSALLTRTRAFACCSGIAIARNGAGC